MNEKAGFRLVFLEVFICFTPITILWVLGVIMMIALVIDGWNYAIWIPSGLMLILGGIGLQGLYLIMRDIYCLDFGVRDHKVYRKLYAGMLSLTILTIGTIISDGLSIFLAVYIFPILCSLHLIYLTKNKRDTTENSIFNDQIT